MEFLPSNRKVLYIFTHHLYCNSQWYLGGLQNERLFSTVKVQRIVERLFSVTVRLLFSLFWVFTVTQAVKRLNSFERSQNCETTLISYRKMLKHEFKDIKKTTNGFIINFSMHPKAQVLKPHCPVKCHCIVLWEVQECCVCMNRTLTTPSQKHQVLSSGFIYTGCTRNP